MQNLRLLAGYDAELATLPARLSEADVSDLLRSLLRKLTNDIEGTVRGLGLDVRSGALCKDIKAIGSKFSRYTGINFSKKLERLRQLSSCRHLGIECFHLSTL